MDVTVVQLLGALKRLGHFLTAENIATIAIPTVERKEFLDCVVGDVNVQTLKCGILNSSKSIGKQERLPKKYQSFFLSPNAEKGIPKDSPGEFVDAVKSQIWAEKDKPDYAYYLMFGIEYLRRNKEDPRAFDVSQRSGLGLDMDFLPSPVARILDNVRSIDALYKLFTSVYKERKLKVAVTLLQQLILQRAAVVLEPVFKMSSIGAKDCLPIWHLLELFLHEVFVVKGIIRGHRYHYDWSYAQLFCHCIRHDCLTFSGETVEISNTVGGVSCTCTLNAKHYVKVLISLVNIVGMILSDGENLSLPLELSTRLELTVFFVGLAPEVIQQLQAESTDFIPASERDDEGEAEAKAGQLHAESTDFIPGSERDDEGEAEAKAAIHW